MKLYLQYDQYDQFKYYAAKNNLKIVKTEYLENIEIVVEISRNMLEEFTKNYSEKTLKYLKCDILKEKNIEK